MGPRESAIAGRMSGWISRFLVTVRTQDCSQTRISTQSQTVITSARYVLTLTYRRREPDLKTHRTRKNIETPTSRPLQYDIYIYRSSVYNSILTYGSKAWYMVPDSQSPTSTKRRQCSDDVSDNRQDKAPRRLKEMTDLTLSSCQVDTYAST